MCFFFLYMFFLPNNFLGFFYNNFLFPSFGNHLRICITAAVKKNTQICFISNKLILWQWVQEFIRLEVLLQGKESYSWVDMAAEATSLSTELQ